MTPARAAELIRLQEAEDPLGGAAALQRRLFMALDGGASIVVVDLGNAVLIDAGTILALMRVAHRLDRLGGELVVVAPDRRLFRILEVTGCALSFRLERSLAAADVALGCP